MCYIETIRIEDGLPYLLALHQERMSRTCDEKGFPLPEIPCLTNLCPPELMCGMTKCRILYGKEGISDVSFSPYTPRQISSLRIVTAPADLDYHLKQVDRSSLEALLKQKGEADEIIILRNGLLTDTSYTNLHQPPSTYRRRTSHTARPSLRRRTTPVSAPIRSNSTGRPANRRPQKSRRNTADQCHAPLGAYHSYTPIADYFLIIIFGYRIELSDRRLRRGRRYCR